MQPQATAVPGQPPAADLDTLTLENDLLSITVLPKIGARVWQITYKPLGADLLWNNPALTPSAQPLYAGYDDNWSGGWDELFPNDEAAELLGHNLPDHGELWTGSWEAEPFQEDGVSGLRLRFTTPITRFTVEKELRLDPHRAVLEIRYRLSNHGDQPLPFLFKLHPAFAVSPAHRIDFPPMKIRREPDFPGTLESAPLEFSWPHAPLADRTLDLRQVPGASSRAVHFFYGTDYTEGWCGVTNRAQKLAAGLRFDPVAFPACWLFATHGGWRDLNVAVLEPATGYPYQMQTMIENGQARYLAPGEALATTVLFSVQKDISSIGGIEADGTIIPGSDD